MAAWARGASLLVLILTVMCSSAHLLITMRFVRRYASLSYLTGSVPRREVPVPDVLPMKSKPPLKRARPLRDISKLIYTPRDLNDYFKHAVYGQPTADQVTKVSTLFYQAKIRHEWTCALYADLPDVKVDRLTKERQEKLASMDPYNKTEYHVNLQNSRTSFGVDQQLLLPLPEILFLGHTNAGKSTLINSLFMSKIDTQTANLATEYAYVSLRAGYTKCLNCYNVGNKLRLVDSPGYGKFGEEAQGKVVLDYIRQRRQLRRTFMVIDSTEGIRDEDAALIEHLVSNGAPFELVFTKVDEVVRRQYARVSKKVAKGDLLALAKEGNSSVVSYFLRVLDDAGVRQLPTMPKLFFNNLSSNDLLRRRQGYQEIRCAIAESCGIINYS